MSRWFKHEDEILPGEKEAEPILGPRFSPFWFFGMAVAVLFVLMLGYIAIHFVVSAAHAH